MGIELKGSALELSLLSILDAGGPAHGYALIGVFRRLSLGRLEVAEGTVYPALHRLEETGLVKGRWVQLRGRERRVYHVTRRGQIELAHRRREFRRWSEAVDRVIALRR